MAWIDLVEKAQAGDIEGFMELLGRGRNCQLWDCFGQDPFDLVIKRLAASPECLDAYLDKTACDLECGNSSFGIGHLRRALLAEDLGMEFSGMDETEKVTQLAAMVALGDERFFGYLERLESPYSRGPNGNGLLNVALVYGNKPAFANIVERPDLMGAGQDRIGVALKQSLNGRDPDRYFLRSLLGACARIGFDVNEVGFADGKGLLHKAAMMNDRESAEALLGAGADPDRQDQSGDNPLMAALRGNRFAVLDCLLECSSLGAKNKLGQTAVDMAQASALGEAGIGRIRAAAEKQALRKAAPDPQVAGPARKL